MGQRILRMDEVRKRVPLGKSTIYLKISKGEFPAPIKLGARAVGFSESSIEQWLTAQIEASERTEVQR